MKELKNRVNIKGELVEIVRNEDGVSKKGREYKSVELVVRTDDGSEHRVRFYVNKFLKDSTEVSKLYSQFEFLNTATPLNEMSSAEKEAGISPTVVRIDGSFRVNDYISKEDGQLKTITQIDGRFISPDNNRTPNEAVFDVDCQIERMRENPNTGEITVYGNLVNSWTIDNVLTPTELIPIELRVKRELVEAFNTVGYFEGICVAPLFGSLVNTVETIEETQAFGKNKVIKRTIRGNIINGGDNSKTIYDFDLTDEDMEMLKTKRAEHLKEVESAMNSSSATTNSSENPFANATAKASNPFAR